MPQQPNDDFAAVVQRAALVSIDLIVMDADGSVLVGLRNNEPAKDFYFVPGGVIRKDEKIADAFERILKRETGLSQSLANAEFLRPCEHFYPTNRYDDPDFGTHYVVLPYRVRFQERPQISGDDQHEEFLWLRPDELLSHPRVHENTKAYFR